MKKLWFPKEAGWGLGGMGWGIGDGNAINLGCDDYCTIINVIKCIELIKERLVIFDWMPDIAIFNLLSAVFLFL